MLKQDINAFKILQYASVKSPLYDNISLTLFKRGNI